MLARQQRHERQDRKHSREEAIASGACLALGCGANASTTRDAGPQGDGLPDANVGRQTDASASDAVVDAPAIDSGPSLPNVASTRVQLWLTADVGVECANGEILAWADQSGKHRDAVHGAHKGPQCPATLHALAGVNLPYFSAPGTVAPFNDETLDVGLGFLAGTEYTIFVVERRWADRTPASGKNEELIGTDLPNQSITACPASGYQINLGYVYYDGFPALNYESIC